MADYQRPEVGKLLLNKVIMANLGKKRLHLSGDSDTIRNNRGSCRGRPALGSRARCPRHACKNVI